MRDAWACLEAGAMAQLIKLLPRNHRDLRSVLRDSIKSWMQWCALVIPAPGRQKQEELGPTGQPAQSIWGVPGQGRGDPVSKHSLYIL